MSLLSSAPVFLIRFSNYLLQLQGRVGYQQLSQELIALFHTFSSEVPSRLQLCRFNWYLRFTQLSELFTVDYPTMLMRFQTYYLLLSLTYSFRIGVATNSDLLMALPTLTFLYPNANWLERENWDLSGVRFQDHPDLRRILTDYGFQGHPLRKDFPVTGFSEVYYDDRRAGVVSADVSLTQEFRSFYGSNPWYLSTRFLSITKLFNV